MAQASPAEAPLLHTRQIPDGLRVDIGDSACAQITLVEGIEPVTNDGIVLLTSRERALMSYASRGFGLQYVAQQFGSHPQLIENRLDNVQGKFGIRETPGLIGAVIEGNHIDVEVTPNKEITKALTDYDYFLLNCFKQGVSIGKIAQALRTTTRGVKDKSKELNGRIMSRGPNHSVRRGFELGIFITQQDLARQTAPESQ